MSYPIEVRPRALVACPAAHPVAIAQVSFNIAYTVQTQDATRAWRLSSDTYDTSLPGGYSSHGDWFNGWKKDVSDAWNAACVQATPRLPCAADRRRSGDVLIACPRARRRGRGSEGRTPSPAAFSHEVGG